MQAAEGGSIDPFVFTDEDGKRWLLFKNDGNHDAVKQPTHIYICPLTQDALQVSTGMPALPCPALPCPALPCPALTCPALPCLALPCLALTAGGRWDSPGPPTTDWCQALKQSETMHDASQRIACLLYLRHMHKYDLTASLQ